MIEFKFAEIVTDVNLFVSFKPFINDQKFNSNDLAAFIVTFGLSIPFIVAIVILEYLFSLDSGWPWAIVIKHYFDWN